MGGRVAVNQLNDVICERAILSSAKSGVNVSQALDSDYTCVTTCVDYCQYDHSAKKIDRIYLGPIITYNFLAVVNFIFICFLVTAIKRIDPN